MFSDSKRLYDEVLSRLRKSRRIAAFSGAGISEESGIATFRGSGGLWGKYRIEEVATPEAFRASPKRVWDFYLERRREANSVRPNAAHIAIAQWGKHFPFVGVVTQNIDDLHRKAGSANIQELHGNLWKARCLQCHQVSLDDTLEMAELPRCAKCEGFLRPHIVWFGEPLDPEVVDRSVEWLRSSDVVFVVGTSGVVEPAASLVRDSKRHGAFLVEVNIEETALTSIVDVSLFGRAGFVLGEWLKWEQS